MRRAVLPLFALLACDPLPPMPPVFIAPIRPVSTDDLEVVFGGAIVGGPPFTYRTSWYRDDVWREDLTGPTVPWTATSEGETWCTEGVTPHGEEAGEPSLASVTIVEATP